MIYNIHTLVHTRPLILAALLLTYMSEAAEPLCVCSSSIFVRTSKAPSLLEGLIKELNMLVHF